MLIGTYSKFEEQLGGLKGKHGDKTEMVKNAGEIKLLGMGLSTKYVLTDKN